MASLTDVYIRSENIVAREIVGEMLLVPISGELADLERVFALDPVGAFVWNKLDGCRNLDALVVEVLAHYDTDRQTAEDDIIELVNDLNNAKLVIHKTTTCHGRVG